MTAEQFTYGGLTASDRLLVRRKEQELLELERTGHKHVIAHLMQITSFVALTATQAREVASELAERRRLLDVVRISLKRRHDAIKQLQARQRRAQEQTQYARIHRALRAA